MALKPFAAILAKKLKGVFEGKRVTYVEEISDKLQTIGHSSIKSVD